MFYMYVYNSLFEYIQKSELITEFLVDLLPYSTREGIYMVVVVVVKTK